MSEAASSAPMNFIDDALREHGSTNASSPQQAHQVKEKQHHMRAGQRQGGHQALRGPPPYDGRAVS